MPSLLVERDVLVPVRDVGREAQVADLRPQSAPGLQLAMDEEDASGIAGDSGTLADDEVPVHFRTLTFN